MRAIAGLVGAGLLAGCATGVPVEREYVVAGDRFANVQGEARLVVRSFVEEADGAHEVLGATCQVTSSLYDTVVTTPARLVVPNFGAQSPELAFACAAGALSGAARRDISTSWRYAPGGYGPPWGYPGMGVYGGLGWGYGWGRTPAYPVSDYRNVNVMLR